MNANQLLANIQLEQYDQLSLSNFESPLVATFGPLAKNEKGEIFFNLASQYEVDQFHPANSDPAQLEKFLELAFSSGHQENIIKLISEIMANIPNLTVNEREILISGSTDLVSLANLGIKGKLIDTSQIKLYLPLTIKKCHIQKIADILKDYVRN